MFKDLLNTDRWTSAGWWAERKKLQPRKSPEMAEAKGNQTRIAEDAVPCLVTQSCPTLCNPMDCSLPGSSVHGDSPGKNAGVGCHALLKRIFPIQGSNPGLHSRGWGVGSRAKAGSSTASAPPMQCLEFNHPPSGPKPQKSTLEKLGKKSEQNEASWQEYPGFKSGNEGDQNIPLQNTPLKDYF